MKRALVIILLLFMTIGLCAPLDPLFRGIPTGETLSVGSPSAGEQVCVQAKKPDRYYVTDVCMDFVSDINSAYVIIKKIYPLPSEYKTPAQAPLDFSHIYGYFFISTSNIREEDYSQMIIGFEVPEEWLIEEGISIDSVKLLEYQEGDFWIEKPTICIGNLCESIDTDIFAMYAIASAGVVYNGAEPPAQPPIDQEEIELITCPSGMVYNETSGECYTPVLVPSDTTDMLLIIIIGVLIVAMFSVVSYLKFKYFGSKKKKYQIEDK